MKGVRWCWGDNNPKPKTREYPAPYVAGVALVNLAADPLGKISQADGTRKMLVEM